MTLVFEMQCKTRNNPKFRNPFVLSCINSLTFTDKPRPLPIKDHSAILLVKYGLNLYLVLESVTAMFRFLATS